MSELFLTCTDALMACLSEYDLKALHDIYKVREAHAKSEMNQHHVIGTQDNLPTTWRLYKDICEALEHEQKRRIK